MYRVQLQDNEDLRIEIFHLKKRLSNTIAENHLLKVKIRKLENEILKKDKQIDVVLDPRKSNNVRKILYERSASFVLDMKEKNDELLDLLHEKDIIIRRLQNQLEVTKLYSNLPKTQFHCKCSDHNELDNKISQIQMKIPCFSKDNFRNNKNKKQKNRNLIWSDDRQETVSPVMENEELDGNDCNKDNKNRCHYDIKDQYKSLSRDHLLSIIENLKSNQRLSPTSRQTSSRKSSPESDLERIEVLCESPHEEIQQLHFHFLDMITEVDHLKNTIAQLQNNQEKTENVLRKKNTNIDKLAQEIEHLKRPKIKSKFTRQRNNRHSSAELATRLYSANTDNSNKLCPRYEKGKDAFDKTEKPLKNSESTKTMKSRKKGRNVMKDATIQVDELNSPESATMCVYVEKDSITITEKHKEKNENDNEYRYDDEVFEECDEETNAVN